MSLKSKRIGLLLGPLTFALVNFLIPIDGLSDEGKAVLACTCWVAIWWMTEATSVEVTALLPIILLPVTGALSVKTATSPYASPLIFLFLGGFILAMAIERWNLHTRIALHIIHKIGTNQQKVVLGFMIATGFLSMWISNTATTLMMMPIGMSVISSLGGSEKFSKALLLAIAYSASIGGMATLIGTPPNVVFAGVVKNTFGVDIGFMDWMMLGVPFSSALIGLSWIYITKYALKVPTQTVDGLGLEEKLRKLGKMSTEEKRVLMVFGITAFLWIFRKLLINPLIPGVNDTVIAIAGAVSLFLISDAGNGKLMHWKDTSNLPWGILILYGGGLSIANAFVQTDLAAWVGEQFKLLSTVDILLLVFVIVVIVNFMTEVVSNIATASLILPILAALAISISVHPYFLMVGAILAASCAFMLPVATAPNAIAFSSGRIKMGDMIKVGISLNIISIILIVLFVYWLMPIVWGIQPTDLLLSP